MKSVICDDDLNKVEIHQRNPGDKTRLGFVKFKVNDVVQVRSTSSDFLSVGCLNDNEVKLGNEDIQALKRNNEK